MIAWLSLLIASDVTLYNITHDMKAYEEQVTSIIESNYDHKSLFFIPGY